ncbi:Putative cytochrome P450 132 [Microbacterium oxydans]|nr:Putative cytochrome P450 132 [Microbacterium oxydans]
MGPYTFTLATSPGSVYRVLAENRANYQRGVLYKQFELVMGRGLLTLDDADWKPHRRAMQPAFTTAAVTSYYPHIERQATLLLDRLRRAAEAGEPVELVSECLRVASAVILEAALDTRSSLADADIRRIVDDSIDVMFPHGSVAEQLPSWLPTLRNRRVRRNRQALLRFAQEIAASHREDRSVNVISSLKQSYPDMASTDVLDEILTIYLAGHETTAMGLCWSLMMLGLHPDSQARAQAEAADLLTEVPSVEDVNKLPYIEACISETLRLYPPIWVFPRDAVEDDVLSGYLVKGGTNVLLSPLVTHRDPEVWTTPTAFVPDRFLSSERRPRGAYFPFGLGARQCIGNVMALLETKALVATVMKHFRIEILSSGISSYGDSLVSLRPLGEVWVRPVPLDVRQRNHV